MKEENCCKCPSKESPLIVNSNSVIKDGHICFCPCHKEENWEKEFGERFIESRYFERIKQFIHSLLKSQRAELIKEIENYFKGLIVITDPQATKESLLTKLKNK